MSNNESVVHVQQEIGRIYRMAAARIGAAV
jgi:hypothetical protein